MNAPNKTSMQLGPCEVYDNCIDNGAPFTGGHERCDRAVHRGERAQQSAVVDAEHRSVRHQQQQQQQTATAANHCVNCAVVVAVSRKETLLDMFQTKTPGSVAVGSTAAIMNALSKQKFNHNV